MADLRAVPEPLQRFCLDLQSLRHESGNPSLATLSREMPGHPGTSTLSDLLAAKVRRPPRWELVAEFVKACTTLAGRTASDLEVWRRRHAELVRTLESIKTVQRERRPKQELLDWLRSGVAASARWSPPGIDPRRGILQQDIEKHLRLPQPVEVWSRPGAAIESGAYPDALDVLSEAVEQGERVLVVGGPGTGKTFLLRNIYRRFGWRATETPDALIPLLLHLADLALSEDSANAAIGLVRGNDPFSVLRALLPQGIADDDIISALSERPVVLLADALDEMPGLRHRDAVERRSRLLTLDLPVVITCRDGYFDEMLGQSELDRSLSIRMTLRPAVQPGALDWFVPRWCEMTASAHSDTILETLKDDPSMRAIADRPLLIHMTVDVADQMVDAATGTGRNSKQPYPWRPSERQWLRLDIFRHYTRRWLEVEAAKTRSDERRGVDVRWSDKDQAMRLIARAQFFKEALRAEKEREHGPGLTEQEIFTALRSDPALLTTVDDPRVHRYLTEDVCRRTFMIRTLRNPSTPRYRFTHKQFLEYYIAHDLLERLSDPDTDASYVVESLSRPLQADSVYFLREGLGDFATRDDGDRRAASANLWRILDGDVKIPARTSRSWVRQHAANLLPQVATADVLPRLVSLGHEEADLFVRRGLAVGLAMHVGVTEPVDAFVRLLDSGNPDMRATARSAALGYSRSYHGDRPFTGDGYDDDSPEASGTTKALVERIVQEVDFVVPIRALTLAELRCLIVEPASRATPWLVRNPGQVQCLLQKISTFANTDDLTRTQVSLLTDALHGIEDVGGADQNDGT